MLPNSRSYRKVVSIRDSIDWYFLELYLLHLPTQIARWILLQQCNWRLSWRTKRTIMPSHIFCSLIGCVNECNSITIILFYQKLFCQFFWWTHSKVWEHSALVPLKLNLPNRHHCQWHLRTSQVCALKFNGRLWKWGWLYLGFFNRAWNSGWILGNLFATLQFLNLNFLI